MTCRRSTCATSSPAAPAADRLGGPGPERHDQPAGRLLAGHQLRELHRPAAAAGPAGDLRPAPAAVADRPVLVGPRHRCAGRAFGDNIARGYVTVDTVNNCTLRFPGDPGYFGPAARATPPTRTCSGATTSTSTRRRTSPTATPWSTSRRAATNPETSVAGQYTFYGRYVSWTAADNREPLATNFAARFVNGGAFSGGTRPASSGATRRSTRAPSPARHRRRRPGTRSARRRS